MEQIIEEPKKKLTRSQIQERYNKENTIRVRMKLNIKYDTDIIEHLRSLPNVQGYLKELIRADIAKNK